jgi:hypothetical protein
MAPDWETLATEFEGKSDALIAEVDCTTEGKPLCDANGVRGFPTLKWGDASALEDYSGGRTLDALSAFAKDNLKPICSPSNLDLCDDDKKAEIEALMAKSEEELATAITAEEKKLDEAEEEFKAAVEQLQKTYEGLMESKEAKIAEVKASGLGLMKAVKGTKAKAAKEEL